MRKQWIWWLVIAGITCRCLWLGSVPNGLGLQEAQLGYYAYSVMHPDATTEPSILHLTTSQRLYATLDIPFISVLKLSAFSVRLVGFLCSVLGLWLLYQLTLNEKRDGVEWPLALLLTSPWHIMATRSASPFIIAPTLILLGALAIAKADSLRSSRFFLGIAMIIIAFGITLPLGELPSNLPTHDLMAFQDNAVQVVKLFFGNDHDGSNIDSIPFWGAQFIWLAPFTGWGLACVLSRSASRADMLMTIWFITGIAIAFSMRASISTLSLVWVPSLWLAALGLQQLTHISFISTALKALLVLCFAGFNLQYFLGWHQIIERDFVPGFPEAITHALANTPRDTKISVMTRNTNASLYIAFFTADSRTTNRFDHDTLITPVSTIQARYLIVQKPDLWRFTDRRFQLQSFGEFSFITSRSETQLDCVQPLNDDHPIGAQDFGTLGINGEVGNRNSGFQISSQYFSAGFGAHGNSNWTFSLSRPANELEIGMGLSDNSSCTDGVSFRILADEKPVFGSGTFLLGDLKFVRVPLHGATTIKLSTDSGPHSKCDHANWVRPLLNYCDASSTPVTNQSR